MARINEHGEILCEACDKTANGETTRVNEDTLKTERVFLCFEHLDHRNKALHR